MSVASRDDELAGAPGVALSRKQRRHHPRKRAVRDFLLRIARSRPPSARSRRCGAGPSRRHRSRAPAPPRRGERRAQPARQPATGFSARAGGAPPGRHLARAASMASRSSRRVRSYAAAIASISRNQIALEQAAGDLAKVDAEIADARAVGHGEIGGDPDQELMQGQPLRPKRNQLARRESGEALHLGDRGDAGKDILRPKNRRQVPQFLGHLRLDAGVPWPGAGGSALRSHTTPHAFAVHSS